jgi:hypothetical protein
MSQTKIQSLKETKMNKRYNDLIKDGYRTTGIIGKEWEKGNVMARADEYRVDGNKVAVVKKVDISRFRDRDSRNDWWVVLVKFSDKYLADQAAKQEALKKEYRQVELRKIADGMSLEELAWMLNDKVNRMGASSK